jgi:hypothetical protein
MGRFLTPDPGGSAHSDAPQSWNQYAYVGSDPINRYDPKGLDWEDSEGCWRYSIPIIIPPMTEGGSFVPVLLNT